MKNTLLLILVVASTAIYAQFGDRNNGYLKEYLKKGNDFYSHKEYSKALSEFHHASKISNDSINGKYIKTMMDSCVYYNTQITNSHYEEVDQNYLIKRIKEKNIELIFDALGHPVSYKKETGEIILINELEPNTKKELLRVKQKYWIDYKK